MLGKKETWFHRNRGFILGFAIVVVVLNILLALALPTQTQILFDGEAQEYSIQDETAQTEHTVHLEGTLSTRAFRSTQFEGTLTLDGETWTLQGERADGEWALSLQPSAGTQGKLLAVRGDRELSSPVLLLENGEEIRFLALHAGNRVAAVRSFESYYSDILHK